MEKNKNSYVCNHAGISTCLPLVSFCSAESSVV